MMKRRYFTRLGAACLLGVALLSPTVLWAQDTDADAPVVAAPAIIDALGAKDVVLDRPGRAPRPVRRHDPSISLQVQFRFDSAELLPQGRRQLDQLATALNDKALLVSGFLLGGHTDRVGAADYNIKLSLARAEAVKAYLAQVHSVSPARLQTIGYGSAHLVDTVNPGSPANRRVEIRRVALLIGAPPARVAPSGGQLVPTPK